MSVRGYRKTGNVLLSAGSRFACEWTGGVEGPHDLDRSLEPMALAYRSRAADRDPSTRLIRMTNLKDFQATLNKTLAANWSARRQYEQDRTGTTGGRNPGHI